MALPEEFVNVYASYCRAPAAVKRMGGVLLAPQSLNVPSRLSRPVCVPVVAVYTPATFGGAVTSRVVDEVGAGTPARTLNVRTTGAEAPENETVRVKSMKRGHGAVFSTLN